MSFSPLPDLAGGSEAGGSATTAGRSHGSGGSEGGSAGHTAGGGGAMTSGGRDTSGGTAGADSAGNASEGGAPGSTGGSAGEATSGSGGSPTAGFGAGGTSPEGGSAGGGGGPTAGLAGQGGSGGSGGMESGPCTPGILGTHTYAFCDVVDDAAAAHAKCQSLGLSLVSIESKLENDYVQAKQSSTWLGGTDEPLEGEWRWVATDAVFWKEKPLLGAFSNFVDGQPNNKDNQGNPENCLVLTKSGWNDVGCELGGFKVTCESEGGPFPAP